MEDQKEEITITLNDRETLRELEELAKSKGITLEQEIEEAMRDYILDFEKKYGEITVDFEEEEKN